jgi:hypothetical protein
LQLLKTGTSYPIAFDKSVIYGAEGKLSLVQSKDRALQIRARLRDIFAEAVDQDFPAKDPRAS